MVDSSTITYVPHSPQQRASGWGYPLYWHTNTRLHCTQCCVYIQMVDSSTLTYVPRTPQQRTPGWGRPLYWHRITRLYSTQCCIYIQMVDNSTLTYVSHSPQQRASGWGRPLYWHTNTRLHCTQCCIAGLIPGISPVSIHRWLIVSHPPMFPKVQCSGLRELFFVFVQTKTPAIIVTPNIDRIIGLGICRPRCASDLQGDIITDTITSMFEWRCVA